MSVLEPLTCALRVSPALGGADRSVHSLKEAAATLITFARAEVGSSV